MKITATNKNIETDITLATIEDGHDKIFDVRFVTVDEWTVEWFPRFSWDHGRIVAMLDRHELDEKAFDELATKNRLGTY